MSITADAIDALLVYLGVGKSTCCPSCGKLLICSIRADIAFNLLTTVKRHARSCKALRADVSIKD
jgi:hypothetical protein